jgi:hypothetical protein
VIASPRRASVAARSQRDPRHVLGRGASTQQAAALGADRRQETRVCAQEIGQRVHHEAALREADCEALSARLKEVTTRPSPRTAGPARGFGRTPSQPRGPVRGSRSVRRTRSRWQRPKRRPEGPLVRLMPLWTGRASRSGQPCLPFSRRTLPAVLCCPSARKSLRRSDRRRRRPGRGPFPVRPSPSRQVAVTVVRWTAG